MRRRCASRHHWRPCASTVVMAIRLNTTLSGSTATLLSWRSAKGPTTSCGRSSHGSSSATTDPEPMVDMEPARSWLFAPGHDEKLLGKVFDAGSDEVLLDLEDGVPHRLKARARNLV